MCPRDIPPDKGELLGVLVEATLYGFSLLMFGGTIWTLFTQRSTQQVNRKILTAACLMLVLSTAHLVVNMIRVMCGLILYRDTFPGGPNLYFSDVSQWTFTAKKDIHVALTLVGDGVLLYRCHIVWQSKLVMILPVLLWIGTGAMGIVSSVAAQQANQNCVFDGALQHLITLFWAMALSTNLLTTSLLVFRIWHVDRKVNGPGVDRRQSQLRPILRILLDAGVIYTVALLVGLTSIITESNGKYLILDIITPIIPITFYMVILRVGAAVRATKMTRSRSGNTSVETV